MVRVKEERKLVLINILETKLNPDGTFKKAKARKVLQGIKGRFMLKGIHFNVVFAATPSVWAQKMLQAIVNLH